MTSVQGAPGEQKVLNTTRIMLLQRGDLLVKWGFVWKKLKGSDRRMGEAMEKWDLNVELQRVSQSLLETVRFPQTGLGGA